MKNKTLLILSRTAPPNVCGVGDYSFRVAEVLAPFYDKVKFGVNWMPEGPQAIDCRPYTEALSRCEVDLQKGETSADILIQFTPKSFSRLGCPWKLLRLLRRLRSKHPARCRIFTLMHETWGEPSQKLSLRNFQQILMKWCGTKLIRLSDGLAAVTQEQADRIRSVEPGRAVTILGVGANILPEEPNQGLSSARVEGCALVFGLSHTRLWTLQKFEAPLKLLMERGLLKQIVSVGPNEDHFAAEELEWCRRNLREGLLKQTGSLPPAQVSQQLLSARFALVSQSTDSMSKSGSFMAYAAHAIPVLTHLPPRVDSPFCHLISAEELLRDPEILYSSQKRTAGLHAWYWETHSWPVIGKQIHAWISQSSS